VLVRPKYPGNVGATARVMRNFGLGQLVLVAPEADLADRQARQLSTHGQQILEQARIVGDLGDAVADCVLVAATSARSAGLIRGQAAGPPDEIGPRLVEACAAHPVALVFGPESSGLTNAEVMRCHHLITIPTDPDYPALNLAQAVAVCLYELRRAWLRQAGAVPAREPPAPFAAQERMFASLRTALEEIHFLWDEKAAALMYALRYLIGRAQPTATEVAILFGLARQIRWYVGRHGPSPGTAAGEESPP
jgi:tRNA/rRNA methyltransferase